jgi:hypothetical protein
MLYFTDEGVGEGDGMVYSLSTISLIQSEAFAVPGADGAWLDDKNKLLYIGELMSKKIHVFNITTPKSPKVGVFDGLNSLNHLHILDDITLDSVSDLNNIPRTVLYGADWTGKAVRKFTLDGSVSSSISPPEGIDLLEPTSVRWGKGYGFDTKSLYVTEGGGATKFVTNRRVLQIPIP